MNVISHLVVVALWVSFRSFPPKDASVALVVTDMLFAIEVLVDDDREENTDAFLSTLYATGDVG